MRITIFLFLLISLSVSSQNFHKAILSIEPYHQSALIQSVETSIYNIIPANEILKTKEAAKLMYSTKEKFQNGDVVESITKQPNAKKEEIVRYVYNEENCIVEITSNNQGFSKFTYVGNEIERFRVIEDHTEYMDTFDVYTLDHEGDIIKITEFYGDGDYSYCTVEYDEQKRIVASDCKLMQIELNENREARHELSRKVIKKETHVVTEENDNFKTIYTYKYGLLETEELYIDNVPRYKWTYTYDVHRNWIEKRQFHGDALKAKTVRKIIYAVE